MSDGGQAAAQAATGDAAQAEAAQQGPDFGALNNTLQALQGSVSGMQDFLQSEPWQQTQEAAQEATDEPIDFSWLDPDNAAFDPQQIQAGLQEAIDRAAEQKLSPLQQQLTQLEQAQKDAAYQREAEALVQEFGELGQPEIAKQVIDAASEYAALNFPPEAAKELAASPAFWRLTYMAGKAAETANGEQAQTAPAAHLEGGGPAPGGSEVDPAEQLFGEARGSAVLPY